MPLSDLHSTYESLLAALACFLLLFGIDDLIPLAIWLVHRLGRRPSAAPDTVPTATERRIAIFVPCWKEAGVIGNMVRHNLAAIRYNNFDFFLGVYPNDDDTLAAAQQLADSHQNVQVAICGNKGPTSKADCLNWIFLRMLNFEEQHAAFFDTMVLHDAEDMVHPLALSVINQERTHYDMVQVPVLPLPTPLAEFTHNVYCDDFAEYQTIDMPVREISKSFIPSNGVGTGYSRRVLEKFAAERNNRVFEPSSLTEDYDSGVRIHQVGFPQTFYRLRANGNDFIATREYFPSRFAAAIKQRTRWVMGIALQGWERHGWRGSWLVKYWFWRDRKGLIGNIAGLLSNVISVAGLVDLAWCSIQGSTWHFAVNSPLVVRLCTGTVILQVLRLTIRMLCVQRLYGWSFAAAVPLRSFYANVINSAASVRALAIFFDAKIKGRPLVWHKTEHAYPQREALVARHRSLEQILDGGSYLPRAVLDAALNSKPAETEIGDYLLEQGLLPEERLCEARSLMAGLLAGRVDARHVKPSVLRALPAHVEQRWHVLPFRIEAGRMLVAGTQIPAQGLLQELRKWTSLEIQFQLITWKNYQELRNLFI